MVLSKTPEPSETARLPCRSQIVAAGALTFAVPIVQWLVSKVPIPFEYPGSLGSIFIVLGGYLWYRKIKTFSIQSPSLPWRVFIYLGSVIGLGLLAVNILNEPISKITGQARSPFEVIDVIVLVPLAEELIFRGVLWSMLERSPGHGSLLALAATSLLFGIEHLGYWAQAGWPLPLEAFLHALSMVGAGLGFGALRWNSGSLSVPVIVHMLANGAILLTQ